MQDAILCDIFIPLHQRFAWKRWCVCVCWVRSSCVPLMWHMKYHRIKSTYRHIFNVNDAPCINVKANANTDGLTHLHFAKINAINFLFCRWCFVKQFKIVNKTEKSHSRSLVISLVNMYNHWRSSYARFVATWKWTISFDVINTQPCT